MEIIKYYCLLTTEELNTQIPDSIYDYMGYDKSKVYLLKDVIFGNVEETVYGLFLGNCLLRTAKYISINDCERELLPEEVPMWIQYVGNVFTDKSGIELINKEEIINT